MEVIYPNLLNQLLRPGFFLIFLFLFSDEEYSCVSVLLAKRCHHRHTPEPEPGTWARVPHMAYSRSPGWERGLPAAQAQSRAAAAFQLTSPMFLSVSAQLEERGAVLN